MKSSLLTEGGGEYNFEAPPLPPRPSDAPSVLESGRSSAATVDSLSRPANWPPCLPRGIVHQDIQGEIPTGFKLVVTLFYFHWLLSLLMLLYNFACAVAAVVASFGDNVTDLVLAIFYIPLWWVIFWLIFRMFYTAARKNRSLYWLIFWCTLVVHLLVCVAALIGWQRSGWIGIEHTIVLAVDGHLVQALMGLVNCLVWGASVAFDVYVGIHVRIAFSKSGGLNAAKGQAITAAATTAAEHPDLVLKAASVAATAATHDFESDAKK